MEELTSTRISVVNELHIVACDLFGSGREVVEMHIRDAVGPVGIDLRHIHPGGERPGETVEQALFRFINLGHTEDIVDVTDYGKTFVGD